MLPPIRTDHLTVEDIPQLIGQTRDAMLEALKEISGENVVAGSGTPKAEPGNPGGEEKSVEVEVEVEAGSGVSRTGSRTEESIAGTETSEEDAVLVDKPI